MISGRLFFDVVSRLRSLAAPPRTLRSWPYSEKMKLGVASTSLLNEILPIPRPTFTDLLPIVRTFLGDYAPDRLDSRSLETLREWKNRVLLEEYYIFNVAIPLEVE